MNPLDCIIVVAYLLGAVAIGIVSRGRQKNIDDYFTAGRGLGGRIGMILVGLSIAPISGLSLLSIPSVSYEHGFKMLAVALSMPVIWGILHYVFLPKFIRDDVRSSYDIIELQYGPGVRTLASIVFVALRVGWLAALVYAPTLTALTVLGLDASWFWPVNLAIGISCTIYTMLGGIRGVIVTDAVQTAMMLFGVAFVICYVTLQLPVGLPEALGSLRAAGQLPIADFSLDPSIPFTFWALFIGLTLTNLSSYMGDQMQLQRFLATGSPRAASRAFGLNVAGTLFNLSMLVTMGVLLRVWYLHYPDPSLPKAADRILPYFVAHSLPPGISGLLMASVLAATMSAMTSGINALSGSLTNDFWVRFGPRRTEKQLLRFARLSSLGVGLCATIAAGFVERLGTIFEIQNKIMGSFFGPLLACMFLVIYRVRLRPGSVIAGMLLGASASLLVAYSSADPLWITPVTFSATFISACVIDALFPNPRRKILNT